MVIKFQLVIMIFFCSLLSCSLDPVLIEPETLGDYYVFCTLTPRLEYQTVRLGKTVPESDPVDIDDATVFMMHNSRKFPFVSIGNGLYRNLQNKFTIHAGQEYLLEITLRNGYKIAASTVIPDSFKILSPAMGDTLHYFFSRSMDTLDVPKIKWERPARALYFSIIPELDDQTDLVGHTVNTFNCEVFFPDIVPKNYSPNEIIYFSDSINTSARLVILAHDSTDIFTYTGHRWLMNYSWLDITHEQFINYFLKESTVHNSNISGAIGRFNGISITKVDVLLKVHIDWD